MSIRSIESASDQRHIKQINNNHSAANKVRKVSAVSIRLGDVLGYRTLLRVVLTSCNRVVEPPFVRQKPPLALPLPHYPPYLAHFTRAICAGLFGPTRLVGDTRFSDHEITDGCERPLPVAAGRGLVSPRYVSVVADGDPRDCQAA